jgi:hypothetical protein
LSFTTVTGPPYLPDTSREGYYKGR